MGSRALLAWRTESKQKLDLWHDHCASLKSARTLHHDLICESIKSYAMSIAANFQTFCRSLYTEAVTHLTQQCPAAYSPMVNAYLTESIALDKGNANFDVVPRDFGKIVAPDALTDHRRYHPGMWQANADLNKFRNRAAHHGVLSPGEYPVFSSVRSWRHESEKLADSLDALLHDTVQPIIGFPPWIR